MTPKSTNVYLMSGGKLLVTVDSRLDGTGAETAAVYSSGSMTEWMGTVIGLFGQEVELSGQAVEMLPMACAGSTLHDYHTTFLGFPLSHPCLLLLTPRISRSYHLEQPYLISPFRSSSPRRTNLAHLSDLRRAPLATPRHYPIHLASDLLTPNPIHHALRRWDTGPRKARRDRAKEPRLRGHDCLGKVSGRQRGCYHV